MSPYETIYPEQEIGRFGGRARVVARGTPQRLRPPLWARLVVAAGLVVALAVIVAYGACAWVWEAVR
jgi:nitrate reductase NapE component